MRHPVSNSHLGLFGYTKGPIKWFKPKPAELIRLLNTAESGVWGAMEQ